MPTANIFDLSTSLVDNNQKVDLNGAVAELQPDEDVFGSTIADWTEDDDPLSEGINGQTWAETGGELIPTAAAGVVSRSVQKRSMTYGDFDIVMHIANGSYIGATATEGATHHWPWKDANNFIYYDYFFQRNTGVRNKRLYCGKRINGAYTTLYSEDLNGQSEMWFRIKRLLTSGPSNNYFYFYTSTDGSSWDLQYSAQIRDAAHFNESDLLYPQVGCYGNRGATTYEPQISRYYQYAGDIVVQRFWPDSPEIYVIDNGAVEWAFDAGVGKTWALTGASCVKNEPGTSTIPFKLGWSNNGLLVGTTWVDGAWQTIAQVNANAAAGNYDGHQYLHVKPQFNSDGTDKPGLTNFSVAGAAVGGLVTGPFGNLNRLGRSIA